MPISKIKSSAIDANAITGAGIADGTVDTADLAAGAVTSAKLDTNIAITGDLTVDTNTLHVDSANNRVGVNTSSPRFPFQVEVSRTSSTNAVALNLSDGVTGIQTDGVYKAIRSQSNGTASESEIRFVETDGTNNNTAIAFATAASAGALSEKMRILPDGGITFNGDTAAANALDDYEEGTFTPSWTNTSSATYNSQLGKYTKVGNVVHYYIRLESTSVTFTSAPYIAGLPFTSNATTALYSNAYTFPTVGFENLGNGGIVGQIAPNTTEVQLYYLTNSSGANYNVVDGSVMNEGSQIVLNVSGHYYI